MGFWDNLKDAIFMDDDDDDDDELYEKEMRELEKKDKSRKTTSASTTVKKPVRSESDNHKTPGQLAQERRKTTSSDKPSYSSKPLTPPRSPESTYTEVYKPRPVRRVQEASDIRIFKAYKFEDAQVVCDSLTSGKAIIVSFEESDLAETQRIMDFICGSIYVLEGNIHTISEKIFLFSPKDVDVSGDYMSMVARNGFGVPTFNKN